MREKEDDQDQNRQVLSSEKGHFQTDDFPFLKRTKHCPKTSHNRKKSIKITDPK